MICDQTYENTPSLCAGIFPSYKVKNFLLSNERMDPFCQEYYSELGEGTDEL